MRRGGVHRLPQESPDTDPVLERKEIACKRVGRNRRLRHGPVRRTKRLHGIYNRPNGHPDVGNDVSGLRN